MILDPDTYVCPTHHVDLTALVREQLEDQDVPFAYLLWPWLWRDLLASRGPSGAREFEVIVSCSGTNPPHKLTCRGKFTP